MGERRKSNTGDYFSFTEHKGLGGWGEGLEIKFILKDICRKNVLVLVRQQPTISEHASWSHKTPLIGAHKAAPLGTWGKPGLAVSSVFLVFLPSFQGPAEQGPFLLLAASDALETVNKSKQN